MKKTTPNITYALIPTSDIRRIALIHESRQKLETILTAFPIKDTLNFCFGGIGSLGVSTYNEEEFKKLAPDHGYKFILRVSPTQDGYTALQIIESALYRPEMTENSLKERLHILGVHINPSCSNKPDSEDNSQDEASHHPCPCKLLLKVDGAKLTQLINDLINQNL